jgi:hypothetical protein
MQALVNLILAVVVTVSVFVVGAKIAFRDTHR